MSFWLAVGVPATQVAEWAGHSITVLLEIYAKIITGLETSAKQRIEAGLQTMGVGDTDGNEDPPETRAPGKLGHVLGTDSRRSPDSAGDDQPALDQQK